MTFNPETLLSRAPTEVRFEFTKRDTMLYALGVGAEELPFVYEAGLTALPTMAVVMASPGFVWREVGADWRRVLHGEIDVEILKTLPVEGALRSTSKFGPIFDKGKDKGAVCYQTRDIFDAAGAQIARIRSGSFLRGDGGFGGSSEGQPKPHPIPTRAPDLTKVLTTDKAQAKLYRLSGDYNPLHIDPEVAHAAGFQEPILHGLCTFGVAGRAVLALLCDNEPSRLRRIAVRFASPVYPGETIRTEVWQEDSGRAAFRAIVEERDLVVLNNGYAEYS